MKGFILMAESSADIPPELAKRHRIRIVPMHISFGGITKDDGTFPAEDVFAYYEQTEKLPTTNGNTPDDFEKAFDGIHRKYPGHHILYLACSAITTCSCQSAHIAAKGRDYVTIIDTKEVTLGQGVIVLAMADYLERNPECSVENAVRVAEKFCQQCHMCFLPADLAYLKAGGRVSNMAYLGARVLSVLPLIELKEGKLVVTKKYRGSIEKIAIRLLEEFVCEKRLKKDVIFLGHTSGFSEKLRDIMTKQAKEMGFERVIWFRAGCVISVHGGPGAFGICGFSGNEALPEFPGGRRWRNGGHVR